MKPYVFAPLALALGFALPPVAAAQQADFLTVTKIACVPERVTRCKSPGVECKSEIPTAREKTEMLIIDFAAKTVAIRRGAEEKALGLVLDDKVEGEVRMVVIGEGQSGDRKRALIFSLAKSGKMEGTRDEGRIKMETTCSPAT